MRKFSYVLILCGILIILYPQANEWYNDWQQGRLLKEAEASYGMNSDLSNNDLVNRYVRVSQLLDEESMLDEEAQIEGADSASVQTDIGGEVIGLIQIDKINLKLPVLEGATQANMKHAAAHMEETAAIGSVGNAAIAAHRAKTTGRLFNRLNEIEVGDMITVTTQNQTYTYKVYDISVVKPTDVSVLRGNNKEQLLTLITCDPLVNPTHRLIVHAKLL